MTLRWTVRALVALGLVVAGATSASAHDALIGSDPADGSVVATAPRQVALTYSADQLAIGTALEVTGPDGVDWVDGAPVVEGTTVVQALRPGLPDGGYTVLWRSVSGDGHPIEGSLTFTLDLPAPEPVAEPADEPVGKPTSGAAAAGGPPDEVSRSSAVDRDEAERGEPDHVGAGPVEWLVAGLAVLAAVGVAVAVILRRRGGGA